MKLDKRTRDAQITLSYDELMLLKSTIIQQTVYLEGLLTQGNRSAENILNISRSIFTLQDWQEALK